ncbi:MAG TPA: rhodanese-like domain-containing protein [Flexivirga sp.]|uniref:rhodanese-like domain-containing protein n=1 Tax=Flexivirga sp. TaxID=1962927 RepID=UPI002BD4B3CA|nr:rhodanese-like domain-containing protein [Flexivirga sp.]HWC21246.1 rhodanese-like domain-containing protein [Flexivirga sp.]
MVTSYVSELTWQSALFTASPPSLLDGGAPASRFAGVDHQLADARSRLQRLSPRAAFQEVLWRRATLVDIRPAAQRATEGEPSDSLAAMTIERNVLEWRLDPRSDARLPVAAPDLRVIVLCQEGYASSLAADSLVSLGVRNATDVVGGFAAWRSLGLPVKD